MQLNLRHMEVGQRGTVKAVKAGGELGRRIRDMGLVPGAEIKVQKRAPVALRVMGFTLTLRNSEADFIDVEVQQ